MADGVTTPPVASGWRALSPALRSPNFRLFWIGQIVSTTGTFLQFVAERWLVYQLTGSTFLLGLLGVVALVPVVPVSLVAGLIIDRFPRRRVIMVTQVGLLAQAVVFGLLIASGQIRIWHIIGLDLVLGMLFAIDQPARQAFLTELVEREDLANAVALNSVLFHLSRVIGFAASGLLIATVGAAGTMLVNAVTYVGPIVALSRMRVRDVAQDTSRGALGVALAEGVRTLRDAPPLLGTISLMAVVGGLAWPIFGMMPAYVESVLDTGPINMGFLLSAGGVGALLGTALVARLGGQRRGRALTVASFLTPLLLLGVAAARTIALAYLFLVALGLAMLVLQALANTLVQVHVPDRVRGRVMSLYTLANAGAPAVAGLLIGAAAEPLGLSVALSIAGLLATAYALLMVVVLPAVRRLD